MIEWEIVDVKTFAHNLWDIHWFGKVYLATMTDVYTYAAAGLEPVDFRSPIRQHHATV